MFEYITKIYTITYVFKYIKVTKFQKIKNIIQLTIAIAITIGFIACGTKSKKETAKAEKPEQVSATPEKPSDADLMAFKVYHHMEYMVTTAKQAGGTNKLFHTKELPTEGTDPVVTPALDHIYTKVIVDLTEGPVTGFEPVTLPM